MYRKTVTSRERDAVTLGCEGSTGQEQKHSRDLSSHIRLHMFVRDKEQGSKTRQIAHSRVMLARTINSVTSAVCDYIIRYTRCKQTNIIIRYTRCKQTNKQTTPWLRTLKRTIPTERLSANFMALICGQRSVA
jgi:hypothetical protein